MDKATWRSALGFFWTRIRGVLGYQGRANSIDNIFNYLLVTPRLATSGQPTDIQFPLIKAQGYTVVINLAPANADNAIADEIGLLDRLGMHYIHIPIEWKNPTEKDFQDFVDSMAELEDKKVWIHCAANLRVSAFIYRYRTQVLGEDRSLARQSLEKIWQPNKIWANFISL